MVQVQQPASPSTAAARAPDPEAVQLLERMGWRSADQLAKRLITSDTGVICVAPPPREDELLMGSAEGWKREHQSLIPRRKAEFLAQFKTEATALIMRSPQTVDGLQTGIARLRDEADLALKLSTSNSGGASPAGTKEAPERPEQQRPSLIARGLRRVFGGDTGDKVTKTVSKIVNLPAEAQQMHRLRQAALDADSMAGVQALLTEAAQFLTGAGRERATLTPVITAARNLAQARLTALRQASSASNLPNDLPAGYGQHLTATEPVESPDMARDAAARALLAAYAEAKAAGERLTAERLLTHVQAASKPLRAVEGQSLEAVLSAVAESLKLDAHDLWAGVLSHLGKDVIRTAPAAPLDPSVSRESAAYAFVITAPDQPAAVIGGDQDLIPTYFVDEGAKARLALCHVRTNIRLEEVLAVAEVRAQLPEAPVQARAYILPEFLHRSTAPATADEDPPRDGAPGVQDDPEADAAPPETSSSTRQPERSVGAAEAAGRVLNVTLLPDYSPVLSAGETGAPEPVPALNGAHSKKGG